jgi:hypothetical protein
MNFKIFCYLRRFGVIPVKSFGSYIHPSHPVEVNINVHGSGDVVVIKICQW